VSTRLISIKEAAGLLSVSTKTLRRWDDDGVLKSIKTHGGHRRYSQDDIDKYMQVYVEENKKAERFTAIYSRVSSHEQKSKGDLDRQSNRLSEYCAKKKYKVEYIIKDVGSGLSDTRNGFVKLMDLVIARSISKVVIEHKDRLTRFQYNLIEKFFNSYGVIIERVENVDVSHEEELVNDLMMLMASFSGKLYGKRSADRRKKKKEESLLKL
jgi:excisionase family DNA binding protein